MLRIKTLIIIIWNMYISDYWGFLKIKSLLYIYIDNVFNNLVYIYSLFIPTHRIYTLIMYVI